MKRFKSIIKLVSKNVMFHFEKYVWHPYLGQRARFYAWVNCEDASIHKSCHFGMPVNLIGQGKVSIAKGSMFGWKLSPRLGNGKIMIQAQTSNSEIFIGEEARCNNNVSIISCESIRIGRRCLIADMVSIFDCDFHGIEIEKRTTSSGKTDPVIIGDDVWLGRRVMVLKGVTIGNGSVIAAGSVVTSSIPERVIAGGVPAKVIRPID